jgi:hypothetical protein
MTCSTSYCLNDTITDPWNVYVSMWYVTWKYYMHQTSSLGTIFLSARLSGAGLKALYCTVLKVFLKGLKNVFKNFRIHNIVYVLRYDTWISQILKQKCWSLNCDIHIFCSWKSIFLFIAPVNWQLVACHECVIPFCLIFVHYVLDFASHGSYFFLYVWSQ